MKPGAAPKEEVVLEEIDGSTCPADLVWAWRAFCSLSRTRHANETGPQPIPVSEVVAYCALIGIDNKEDREDLLFLLDALDITYLKVMHDRITKARDDAKRKSENRSRGRGR